MSTFYAVGEARRRCEVEEVRSNDSICLCRNLLTYMKIKHLRETEKQLNLATNVDSLENTPDLPQELQQLEKLLERAFRARSTSATNGDQRRPTSKGKDRPPFPVNCKLQSESISKDSCNKRPAQMTKVPPRVRTTQGTTRGQTTRGAELRGPAQRDTLKAGGTVPFNTGEKTKVSFHKSCSKDLVDNSKQDAQQKTLSSEYVCKTVPSDPNSQAIPEQMWIPSPLLPAWSALQNRQRRLWDEVLTKSAQVVPEKMHFTQKLQSTFATKMPPEAPADTGAGMDCLTELGRALQQCHHTELRLSQSSTSHTRSGDTERQHKSEAMRHGVEERMKGVLVCIEQLVTALDEHYGWDPGVLCPVRRRGRWGNPLRPCLPSGLCYTSPAQLQELAYLRLRVELLHQETLLQQVLQDVLSAGPSPCSAAHLRGRYSLLGEGGLYFPTLVMDTEPE
ncbi:hypothetical protein ACEWY4_003728 [Coilia grayii]|uniref:Tubulin epsilon and delta complex protein 2 n=1 Tax=Coilia grayii TaxID=363190 RepID=A0ABD1KS40_9TELE